MDERLQLEEAIRSLEMHRGFLGNDIVDILIVAAREKLATLRVLQPQKKRKQTTILFADVVGFTAMTELMDPEAVHDLMNIVWNRLDGAILHYGGTIDKHIGDAVMALWGVDSAREDDPELKFTQGICQYLGEDALDKAHLIGHLLGFDFSSGPYLRGILDDPKQIRDRAFHYLGQFFQAVTKNQTCLY